MLMALLNCSSLFPWPPQPATLWSPSMVSVSQSTAFSTCVWIIDYTFTKSQVIFKLNSFTRSAMSSSSAEERPWVAMICE